MLAPKTLMVGIWVQWFNSGTVLGQAHLHTTKINHVLWTSLVAPESADSAGDPGSIPGWRRSPGEGILACILAWKIPRTEEPGRLQALGSQELDTA